jgi:hypothetical protein
VELGELYDQEIDPSYRALDLLIRKAHGNPDMLLSALREKGYTFLAWMPAYAEQDVLFDSLSRDKRLDILVEDHDLIFGRIK